MCALRGVIWAGVLACAGCGRLGFDARGGASDASGDGGGLATCHTGAFAPPTNLGAANSGVVDWAPSLSGDGTTLYFGSLRGGGVQGLYTASRTGGTWSSASRIVELSTADGEGGNPSIRRDGLALCFGETRVYRSTRSDLAATWGARQVVVDGTAQLTSPNGPELSDDAQTLYFTATQAGHTDTSIWTMPAGGGAATQLVELDTPYNDGWATVTGDELEMFYTSYLATSGASTDIYRATRATRTDPWTPQGVVTELAVAGGVYQEDASISADGRTLVFASRRAGGAGDFDLWITTRACM